MSDIAAFLEARLAEDEAAAQATTPVPMVGQWCASRDKHAPEGAKLRLIQGRDPYEGEDWNQYESGEYNGTPIIALSAEWQDEAEANLRYIARFDPARVLAEIAAKRSIVEDYHIVVANNAIEKVNDDDEVRIAARDLIAKSLRMALRRLAAPYADHPDYDRHRDGDAAADE